MNETKRRRPNEASAEWLAAKQSIERGIAGRISDYAVPRGTLMLTMSGDGVDHVSTLFDLATLHEMMAYVHRQVTGMLFDGVVVAVRRAYGTELAQTPPRSHELGRIAAFALWTTLNCPETAGFAERLSDWIRDDKPAHVTWYATTAGALAFSLHDKFVELAGGLEAAAATGTTAVDYGYLPAASVTRH